MGRCGLRDHRTRCFYIDRESGPDQDQAGELADIKSLDKSGLGERAADARQYTAYGNEDISQRTLAMTLIMRIYISPSTVESSPYQKEHSV